MPSFGVENSKVEGLGTLKVLWVWKTNCHGRVFQLLKSLTIIHSDIRSERVFISG